MTAQPFFYLIAASLLWGATAPIMKLTLTQVPLFTLAFIRMLAASLIILPLVYKKIEIKKEDYKLFAETAFFGVNVNLTLFFLGLNFTNAINSAVITSAVPIFTLAFAIIFLKEKMTSKLIFANIFSFIGVLTVIGLPIFENNFKSTLGNIFLVIATIAWVIHEISTKKLLKKYAPLTVTFYTTLIGAVIFLPGFLLEAVVHPEWVSTLRTDGLLGLIYGILFSSILAYFFWNKGLAKLKNAEASFFFYLNPVSAVFFSIILLGEKITTPLIIGLSLIVFGVVLVENNRHNHPLHK